MSRYLRPSLACLLFFLVTVPMAAQYDPPRDNCLDEDNACSPENPPGTPCTTFNGESGECQYNPAGPPWCPCVVPPPPSATCDPGGILTLKSSPITTFPATRIFKADGVLTITGVNKGPTASPVSGTLQASFGLLPDRPGIVQVKILNMSLTIPSILLDKGEPTGATSVRLVADSGGIVDRVSGATRGTLYITATNGQGTFDSDRIPYSGLMNFASGQLVLSTSDATVCARCDINHDGHVDRDDIALILEAIGSPAMKPVDPRDVDRDGTITINDALICSRACDKPLCAK